MKQLFWVAKDKEGNFKPNNYIYSAEGNFGNAAKQEWADVDSKKKSNTGLTLVKVSFEEITNL